MLRTTLVCLFLLCIACDDTDELESVDVAKMCVEKDLSMVCPLGTAPNLDASASSMCSRETNFSGDGSAIEQSGSASLGLGHVCVGDGECLIKCDVVVECEYGYEVFTRDEIVCSRPD